MSRPNLWKFHRPIFCSTFLESRSYHSSEALIQRFHLPTYNFSFCVLRPLEIVISKVVSTTYWMSDFE